jgi:2-polyprenyl-3-methyl-5-hydroxy-6-metoxy-1,4-benzoquinol methylase
MSEPEFSLDEVARYWDDNAAAWAREVRQGHDVARELLNNPAFLALIGDLRGRAVLDAGCGDGYNTRMLARTGARMTGVDLSARMIALAQDEERRDPLGIRCARASYTELALFADATFDAVVSFMALVASRLTDTIPPSGPAAGAGASDPGSPG